MTDLYIDPTTGDLEIGITGPRITTSDESLEAIAQRITIRCRRVTGEWFEDPLLGLPWDQVVGAKSTDVLVALVREEVRTTPGVESVTSVEVERTDRAVVVTFSAIALESGEPVEASFTFP